MSEILTTIYMIVALIFAATGIVLLRARSAYPDTRAGYHVKKAMESEENWDYANSLGGKLCLIFTVVFLFMPLLVSEAGGGNVVGMAVLIIAAVIAVGITIFLPVWMLGRKKGNKK